MRRPSSPLHTVLDVAIPSSARPHQPFAVKVVWIPAGASSQVPVIHRPRRRDPIIGPPPPALCCQRCEDSSRCALPATRHTHRLCCRSREDPRCVIPAARHCGHGCIALFIPLIKCLYENIIYIIYCIILCVTAPIPPPSPASSLMIMPYLTPSSPSPPSPPLLSLFRLLMQSRSHLPLPVIIEPLDTPSRVSAFNLNSIYYY